MTETGGTVERLRELEAATETERAEVEHLIADDPNLEDVVAPNPIYWWRYMRESMRAMPALLAVVEAAQEARAWAHQDGPYARQRAAFFYGELDDALDALHTQASDEGEA